MSKILGLDLGTNSLGWAITDTDKEEILGMGVRIFPMGVSELGKGEKELSKNASRTGNRQKRRQFARKRFRKKLMIKVLAQHSMCPLSPMDYEQWKKEGKFPEGPLRDWFKMNPYELRARSVKEKVSLHELGRVFYHMIQRRGFLSNARKGAADEGVLFSGKPKEGKTGIDETLSHLSHSTLGSYLHSIAPVENEPFKDSLTRIRNRYTTRAMYIQEFEQIWSEQSKHHALLTAELRGSIGGQKNAGYKKDGILFFQRPLRSQKGKIGACSLEPKKARCPISAIPFEEFRLWQWINTVEFNGYWLNDKQRHKAFNYLIRKEKVKFKALRSELDYADASFKSNYANDDTILGSRTISLLCNKKFFGERWFKFTDKEREDIWHDMLFYEDKKLLTARAIDKWKLDPEAAEKLASTNLADGYANFSRKALMNILPFLEKGCLYDIAVALGGIKNLFGKEWDNLSEEQTSFILDNVPEIVRSNQKGGYIKELMKVLADQYGFSEADMEKKLYHHSSSIAADAYVERLPVNVQADKEIQAIRNPVVITAMFELRKVVNELLERFGPMDRIVVEMARDLKNSKSRRQDERRRQQKQENYNNEMKGLLAHHGQRVSHDNLLLIKLWKECQETCPYTGRSISVQQLFSGEVQIEHILPWSRTLNDSFMNKTLCFADENRAKGDKTPYEYYSGQSEAKWEEVKARALSLFHDSPVFPDRYRKFKQFTLKKFDEDFVSRQLNDTRYISRQSKDYLSQICKDVRVSPGQVTSKLRHLWGLNNLIGVKDSKERDDHRHHAIDALTVAATEQSAVQKLNAWNRYDRGVHESDFPAPWKTFRSQAEKTVNELIVSHRCVNNDISKRMYSVKKKGVKYSNLGIAARGPLHLETVFGKRKAPGSEDYGYHVRKSLDGLSKMKQIEKVVDSAIRELIYKHIAQLGGFQGKNKDEVPKGAFFDTNEDGSLRPLLFLPNKNGAPVPIIKVRMKENFGNAEPLKDGINQYVNPRNNHHVIIYEDEKGNLQEDVVTFWTVVERRKQGQDLIQLPKDGKKIISVLQINDMFSLQCSDGQRRIYRVQKLSSKFYEFRLNSESLIAKNEQPHFIRVNSFGTGKTGWLTFEPEKVIISPSGMLNP